MQRIEMLCDVAPEWVEIKEYSKSEKYLRLKKGIDLGTVKNKIAAANP
jgi:hypothetical protein